MTGATRGAFRIEPLPGIFTVEPQGIHGVRQPRIARDLKYFGAGLGFFSIPCTRDRNPLHHPHLK